mgnify:CR=1 FL=1
MTKFYIIRFILFLGLINPSVSFAELIAEESIENRWGVDIITENSVHATVNGQVTHGDRLHVRMIKDHCDKGNLITFVYTYSNHPEIEQLRDQYVMTNFMGGEVIVNVLFASPFLMGHRATVDIGWADIEELKIILSSENPITMEYKDSSEIKITDNSTSGVTSKIEVRIDGTLLGLWEPTRFEIYQQTTDIGNVRIEGDTISGLNSNQDLELIAPGTGSVRANDSFVINNRPSVQDPAVDPLYDANGVKLYAKSPSGGDTGLYFVNTNDTRGEVISKNRALLFGLIF